MVSGALDPSDTNMAAPLLARSYGEWPFALVSAIAFTTVLGTVSGLILAASGAVAHDIMSTLLGHDLGEKAMVKAGKVTAIAVGILAMALGILFKGMNVSFLVGWAFNVAASANLPALVMILFWKGTTKQGVAASITSGLVSSMIWILLSKEAMTGIYHLPADRALVPFSQPAIVTIPLAFIVLVIASRMTANKTPTAG
jgi:cation/acetate symporter